MANETKKKNKKIFIILGTILIALIAAGVAVFLILDNNTKKKNKELFDKLLLQYNTYVKIAEKVNDVIKETILPIEEATKKDVGEDKTIINNLISKKDALLKYNIVIDKKKFVDKKEIEKAINVIKEALIKVDENIINSKVEDVENVINKEGSNINTIKNESEKLIKDVNTAADKEKERKEIEETFAKYAGTYINPYGGDTITLKNDGTLIYANGKLKEKPESIKKDKNGIIDVKTGTNKTVTGYKVKKGYTIYPVGKGSQGNKKKVRLHKYDGIAVDEYEKK